MDGASSAGTNTELLLFCAKTKQNTHNSTYQVSANGIRMLLVSTHAHLIGKQKIGWQNAGGGGNPC